jgi:hypothetical protein
VKISMVRCPRTWALGRIDVVGRALTSKDSTLRVDKIMDADRPAPPPPTMRTGTVVMMGLNLLDVALHRR